MKSLNEGGKVTIWEGGMSVVNNRGGMRFAIMRVTIDRRIDREGGAKHTEGSDIVVDREEDVGDNQTGAEAGEGTALEEPFFLKKRTEVKVGITVPDGGGIGIAKVIEGEEVM